ncbi:MAG: pesticin C-terminus-like muramidase [Pseudomonadota bacterium]|nr:pesticin C-terminus-like muramidase [Pseudomonadota bacterium]
MIWGGDVSASMSGFPNRVSIQGLALMYNVDWDMIEKYEINTDFGYAIPNDANSGVTVGCGFDLGRHSVNQINALPIAETLKAKLRPYAQLTGAEARNALYSLPADGALNPRQPIAGQIHAPKLTRVANKYSCAFVLKSTGSGRLELDPDEVTLLNQAVRDWKMKRIASKFDADAVKAGGKPFATIPASTQTAIASFCWHYGENIGWLEDAGDRRLRYWKLVVKGDWTNAIELIFSAFMKPKEKSFEKRRREEVDLLRWGMQTQKSGPLLRRYLNNTVDYSRVA